MKIVEELKTENEKLIKRLEDLAKKEIDSMSKIQELTQANYELNKSINVNKCYYRIKVKI